MQWFSAKQAAQIRNVATATIIGLIEDPMKRPAKYAKPQTLRDYTKYRLNDLCEFHELPDNERDILVWWHRTFKPNDKIGTVHWVTFRDFRQIYEILQRNKHFQKSIAELEALRAAGGAR